MLMKEKEKKMALSKNKEKLEAEQTAISLNQMYQAGFLDGYNSIAFNKKKFKSLKKKCFKSFQKRFKNFVMSVDTSSKGDKGGASGLVD